MEESIGDINLSMHKLFNATCNFVVGISAVLSNSVITGVLIGCGSGNYVMPGGIIARFLNFLIVTTLLSVGFFIAQKKKEGSVILLVSFLLLLFGYNVCNGLF